MHAREREPDIRFSTIMEDLKRRDFSINAIAISLNANSRGLLLDPTNGLADLERREIRALSIHSFTNQPVRLLRALRYAARMGFEMDARTAEWFKLAMERGLHDTIPPEDAGSEFRQVAREEKPAAVLKAWESRSLLSALHPQLAKRHPDYEAINRITRVRDDMWSAGFRPRLFAPVAFAVLGRLKARERSAALIRMGLRAAEIRRGRTRIGCKKDREDPRGTQDGFVPGCLCLSGKNTAGLAGIYSGRVFEFEGCR